MLNFKIYITMKTLSIIILSIISTGILSANPSEVKSSDQCLMEYQDLVINYDATIDLMPLPYAKGNRACMKQVSTNGEYSLWRVSADAVVSYNSVEITGKAYNYFVYKQNRFHLTVNESNKNYVYNYFIEVD